MKRAARTPRRGCEGDTSGKSNQLNDESPGVHSASFTQRRLQGSARVVRDHCADWHNFTQRWDELNDQGFELANEIVNLKLQHGNKSQTSETLMLHEAGAASRTVTDEVFYPDGLEELCQKFTDIFESMNHLTEKMKIISDHFRGVRRLELHQSQDENPTPLFKTWTVEDFCDISEELEEMFCKEIKLKQSIMEDIAHQTSRDVLMTYISLWQHQPYIEEKHYQHIQSLLLETSWVDP